MAALKPAMAFIIDIRRGNLQLHLMYKALFELSADRADFVSRLFSLKRPSGLGARVNGAEHLHRLRRPGACGARRSTSRTCSAIERLYVKKNGLGLSQEDLKGIEGIYQTFSTRGLGHSLRGDSGKRGILSELRRADGGDRRRRRFRAATSRPKRTSRMIKDLHSRNLIVPVVGNFGGPKAHSGSRQVPQGTRRRRRGLLRVERRAVSASRGRHGRVLRQCGIAPARRVEHVHQERARRAAVTRRRWLPTRRFRRFQARISRLPKSSATAASLEIRERAVLK